METPFRIRPDVVVTHRALRSWDEADATGRNYLMDYGFQPGRRVRLMGFLTGLKDGLLKPADRRTGHFVSSRAEAS